MKILQIVGNSAFGGATYLILKWCCFLVENNCKVDVISTDKMTVDELRKIPGVRVIEDIFIPRDISPKVDLIALIKLVRVIRKERYHVVHTYTATPGFLGRFAARLENVPAIFHHQAGWTITDYSTLVERAIYTPLEFLAAVLSTKSICVSYAVEQEARKLHIAPQNKFITIRNGIDPTPFISVSKDSSRLRLRKEMQIPDSCIVIGNAGRISVQKDIETLIKALVVLKEKNRNQPFILLLAGDGADRDKLEQLVDTVNLSDRVRFLGFYKDIPSFLAGIDIFITPSLREGLSISLLEAMSSACPIITTNIPPNAELIEHGVHGLLVQPKAPHQIAEAIQRFIDFPEFAASCGLAARQKVIENYTIDRMFRETWDLYCSSLMKKPTYL